MKTEKGNLLLLQTQFESAQKREREIIEDTRNQMRLTVFITNKELELKADKLDEKNNEINMLTASLREAKTREYKKLKMKCLTLSHTFHQH